MRVTFLLLCLPLLLAARPALDEQTRKDLLCYAVMTSLAETGREKGDSELTNHAQTAAGFFLKRVISRAPHLDLAQAMAAEAAALGNSPIADFVPGCIDARMRYLESVTKSGERSKR